MRKAIFPRINLPTSVGADDLLIFIQDKERKMPKPENPGSQGKDKAKAKDVGRDIDKWLPPKRPWVAVTIPAADSGSGEILFDPLTQKLEILGHQFDEDGEQVPRKMDVTVEETPTGAVLSVAYPAVQVLYKVVDTEDEETPL